MQIDKHTICKEKLKAVSSYFFTLCFLALFLSSCGGAPEGQFQLEGRFKNINQGEFYIYDLQHGTKDTIAVRDGRFSYTTAMSDTTVLTLLFPNYSELPIFAQPGAKVKMDGDVTHLRETSIKGTEANRQMTDFRLAVNDMTPQQATEYAEKFINEHPSSILAPYLLHRYFLVCQKPDYQTAESLCATINQAQPQNLAVIRLMNQLGPLRHTNTTDTLLPSFKAIDADGDTISNKHFRSKVSVICLWSSWNYDSQSMLRLIRTIQKENSRQLAVMSISIDAAPSEGRYTLERDSISWPNICDSTMWKSPLVALFGLQTIPDNIVLDKEGRIVGRTLNNADLKSKIDSLLKQ